MSVCVELSTSGCLPCWQASRLRRSVAKCVSQHAPAGTAAEVCVTSPDGAYLEPIGKVIEVPEHNILQQRWIQRLARSHTVMFLAAVQHTALMAYTLAINRLDPIPEWLLFGCIGWTSINIFVVPTMVLAYARWVVLKRLLREFQFYFLAFRILQLALVWEVQRRALSLGALQLTQRCLSFIVHVTVGIIGMLSADCIHAYHWWKCIPLGLGTLWYTWGYAWGRWSGVSTNDVESCEYGICFSTHGMQQSSCVVLAAFGFRFFVSVYLQGTDYVLIGFPSTRTPTHPQVPKTPPTQPFRTLTILPPAELLTAIQSAIPSRTIVEDDACTTVKNTRILITLHTCTPPTTHSSPQNPADSYQLSGASASPSRRKSAAVQVQYIVPKCLCIDITGPCLLPWHARLPVIIHVALLAVGSGICLGATAIVIPFGHHLPDSFVLGCASVTLPSAIYLVWAAWIDLQTGALWHTLKSFIFWFLAKNILQFCVAAIHIAYTSSPNWLIFACRVVVVLVGTSLMFHSLSGETIKMSRVRHRGISVCACVICTWLLACSRFDTTRDWDNKLCFFDACVSASEAYDDALMNVIAFLLANIWGLWKGQRYPLLRFAGVGRRWVPVTVGTAWDSVSETDDDEVSTNRTTEVGEE